MSDDREPVECCKCHQSMSLDDGCEWGDSERLYCWGCAHDEIERLRAIVDRVQKDADGNPILPGDVGFALRFPALGGKPHIIQMRVDAIEIACIRSWKDGTARPENFYRSREAAEKARKA